VIMLIPGSDGKPLKPAKQRQMRADFVKLGGDLSVRFLYRYICGQELSAGEPGILKSFQGNIFYLADAVLVVVVVGVVCTVDLAGVGCVGGMAGGMIVVEAAARRD
jgi:hypothetical protein